MNYDTPMRKIWNVWIIFWENLDFIVDIWNFPIFNGSLNFIESIPPIEWLLDLLNISDLSVPVDIEVGEFILIVGLNVVIPLLLLQWVLSFIKKLPFL